MSGLGGTSEIDRVFDSCRALRRAAFVPYVTAGDPDLETTLELIGALADGGADLIELGVPFSDPIADGPVNQRAAVRALASGTTLSGVLRMVSSARQRWSVPIVLFTYFNPILARGVAHFASQAAASGVDGVLTLDLPPEEASGEYIDALRANELATVFLVAPTSTRARIRRADELTRGFVYYVARTGVTGDRRELAPELLKQVKAVRRKVRHPLAVGFGISTPEHVAEVGSVADGVVVGSALVRLVEEHGRDAAGPVAEAVRRLSEPLRTARRGRRS